MSRNTKIILAIAAGALVLLAVCACLAIVGATMWFRTASVSGGPEIVVERAEQVVPGQPEMAEGPIAGVTLPAGWVQDYSMRLAGFRLTGYKPQSGTGHIILAVLPEMPGQSIDEMERELRALTDAHGYRWNRNEMRVVERKQITVMGQPTEMVISEGAGSSGNWRQAMTSFRGEYGLTLVVYGMPEGAYSQADADSLFASIR